MPALDPERLERSGECPSAVTLRLAQQRANLGEVGGGLSAHGSYYMRSVEIISNETIPGERDCAHTAPLDRGSDQLTGTGCGGTRPTRRPRCSLTNRIAIDPSPTAEATRFTEPLRTSPAANTPGVLVSSM